jgi:hypothetical protein
MTISTFVDRSRVDGSAATGTATSEVIRGVTVASAMLARDTCVRALGMSASVARGLFDAADLGLVTDAGSGLATEAGRGLIGRAGGRAI